MTTEFVFVFTGHGKVDDAGTGRLVLADGPLSREELFAEVIDASPADFNHVIIDACNAYYLVMARGAWKDDRGGPAARDALQAYLESPDTLSRRPTTGVILSTAGTAEVHEWERYRSGVFSHELRSGLLGPADVDVDGNVTYGELESFLTAANAGVTNPKARVQVFVQAPLQNLTHPLIELRGGAFTHFLEFPQAASGHFRVEDSRGMAYAEWNKAPDHRAYLALLYPPVRNRPRYFLRRGDKELSVRLAPSDQGPEEISFKEEEMAAAGSGSRGSVDESFRRELFIVPFGRAFAQGFAARRDSERITGIQRDAGSGAPRVHALSAAYILSDSAADKDGMAHGVRLAYRWSPWDHFHLTARLGWRRSSGRLGGDDYTTDDLDLQVGGGVRLDLPGATALFLEGTAGYHWIARRRTVGGEGGTIEEPDDFAPALGVFAGLRWHPAVFLFVQGAGGVCVVFTAPEKGEETMFVPEGTLSVGFLF